MEVITAVAAWAISSACQNLPVARDLLGALCAPVIGDVAALQNSLSPAAKVYLPGSNDFDILSERWSLLGSPKGNLVVVPATDNDVSETVKYANKQNLPFLAHSGAHGAITTLGKMTQGIVINLSQLSSVEVSKDGKTARIGGGTLSKDAIDKLWDAGKQTVTGTCECVSLVGPALGGGHGWLQGHYGLIGDQFVSMDLVLADGQLKTVDAKSDLWWALNGAGHNFGIVTSVTTKVYDAKHRDWAIEIIIFSGDKVGAVYDAANKYLVKDGKQPVDVVNWSYWLRDPTTDPENPVIIFYIIQEGVKTVETAFTKPFHDLGPLVINPMNGSYRDLAAWTFIASDSPPCQKAGLANPRFPIYLQEYDVEAQKAAYESFASATAGPSPFNGSIFIFESYALHAVQAIESKSSAFAFRDARLLVAPLISYKSNNAVALDEKAAALGNKLRDILHKASGRVDARAYVNYAFGDESPRGWYGSEQWRQDRLRELKKKYDPSGRFSFYGPIV